MQKNDISEVMKESNVLFSGALKRRINSYYPNRHLMMGIAVHDPVYRVWALPMRYDGPDANLEVVLKDFQTMEEAVDYFMDFMRDSCKDVVEISQQNKVILKTYLFPNTL